MIIAPVFGEPFGEPLGKPEQKGGVAFAAIVRQRASPTVRIVRRHQRQVQFQQSNISSEMHQHGCVPCNWRDWGCGMTVAIW
jgi:hypothetical protein